MKSQTFALSSRWRFALHLLFLVTLINYIAQIPYYIHFYGIHHIFPSTFGIAFLGATFVLFLVGYFLALRSTLLGWWLLTLFLLMEFGGYLLHNLTGAFLRDVPMGDPLFLTVSLIGYLNFAFAFVYLLAIARNYRLLLLPREPMDLRR